MTDDVAKAVALHKKLAASLMVRRDDLELQLKSGGETPELRAELAGVQADLAAALAEIKSLTHLAGEAKLAGARATVMATDDTDPFIKTAEETALDNVRDHARSLEAQVKVGDELSGRPAAAAAAEKPTAEKSDEQARAEFEALRGKRPKTF